MPRPALQPLGHSQLTVPPIGLGTWAIGGLHWGGTDAADSEAAIMASIEHGVTLIDTAPVYGFGLAEEIVGETLKKHGLRDRVVLATKCGLEWSDDKKQIRRNSAPERIRSEIDASLRQLHTDIIDLYQIHWPDTRVPFADSLAVLEALQVEGKIRAFGVSNFSVKQLQACLQATDRLASNQPPYNLFERAAKNDILPFCHQHHIGILAYGALCRGLLSGRITVKTTFPPGDLRRIDPKFKPDKRPQYLKAVARLKKLAEAHDCTVGQFAIAWACHQPGVTCTLAGARSAPQAEANARALSLSLTQADFDEVDRILKIEIKTPVGPEFFAPPV